MLVQDLLHFLVFEEADLFAADKTADLCHLPALCDTNIGHGNDRHSNKYQQTNKFCFHFPPSISKVLLSSTRSASPSINSPSMRWVN